MRHHIVLRGCGFISTVAIFTLLCTLIAIVLTIIWWVCPFCAVNYIVIARWPVAVIVILYLIFTKRIIINPHRAD